MPDSEWGTGCCAGRKSSWEEATVSGGGIIDDTSSPNNARGSGPPRINNIARKNWGKWMEKNQGKGGGGGSFFLWETSLCNIGSPN